MFDINDVLGNFVEKKSFLKRDKKNSRQQNDEQ